MSERGGGRFRDPRVLAAVLIATSLVVGGCASTGLRTAVGRVPTSDPDALTEPWQIEAAAMPSQRLYRIKYSGPEGELAFKLTLYLEAPERFRMLAADTLGRKLWVLRVADRRQALWINHRDRSYCWAEPSTGLAFVPLTRLPLGAFPRLLLGRLPANPALDLREATDRLSYLDDRGRQWTARLEGGAPVQWTVAEDDEAVAWWQRVEDGGRPESLFSDRRGQQQVRWREIVSEPMAGSLEADEVPPDYREDACGADTLAANDSGAVASAPHLTVSTAPPTIARLRVGAFRP